MFHSTSRVLLPISHSKRGIGNALAKKRVEATLLSLCRKLENLRGNGQLQHLDYRAEAREDGYDATGFPTNASGCTGGVGLGRPPESSNKGWDFED